MRTCLRANTFIYRIYPHPPASDEYPHLYHLRLAATIHTVCRLICIRTLTKYGVAIIADLFVKAITCPFHAR